jgi:hypothetical protein
LPILPAARLDFHIGGDPSMAKMGGYIVRPVEGPFFEGDDVGPPLWTIFHEDGERASPFNFDTEPEAIAEAKLYVACDKIRAEIIDDLQTLRCLDELKAIRKFMRRPR